MVKWGVIEGGGERYFAHGVGGWFVHPFDCVLHLEWRHCEDCSLDVANECRRSSE